MPGVRPLLFGTTLLTLAGAACEPVVLIARSENATAGYGGAAPLAGSSGNGAGGTGGRGGSEPIGAQAGAPEVPDEPARLLADSVADFALEQGVHGWYYGFDTGVTSSFTLLTRTSVITTYVPVSGDIWNCWTTEDPHWTQLFELGAHANGVETSTPSTPVLERAVRRWISNYAGEVRISGEMAKIDDSTAGESNGVDASVVVDGTEVYSSFIEADDSAGLSYDLTTTVNVGSKLDFVLDAHDSNDRHDLTRFTAVVERVIPEDLP